MAYVGAAPANRVLSSADIAQGSVTLDDINFTDQPANMDISGAIDKHTMRLADGVTVTGDVTISDDLVLAKLSDDGNAITLTDDGSSRTITGSGSIEAATLAQTPNASLTGMTGTLGSGVTIGSGVTFPASHVTKVHHHPLAADVTMGGSIATYTYQTVVVSPSSGTSKLYAFHSMHYKQGDGGGANFYPVLEISGNNVTNITHTGTIPFQMASETWAYYVVSFVYGEVLLDGTASDVTFVFRVTHGHQNNTTEAAGNNANETVTTIIEIY